MQEKLPLDAKITLLSRMLEDFEFYSEAGVCPEYQEFNIVSRDEDLTIESAARLKAFKKFAAPIVKNAFVKTSFDTRRIDQETERNPRRNLQYWHRDAEFIDQETEQKLKIFAKLDSVVKEIESKLCNQMEYMDSYVRVLSGHLNRVKFAHDGDGFKEVFKPHISYLEQLIYNRYRLTLDDINAASDLNLRKIILAKDEELEKKEQFLISTGGFDNNIKTGDISKEDKIVQAIQEALKEKDSNSKDALSELFGGSFRKPGERKVERTITIRIVDSVVE